jgi:hypothetical protein
MIEIQLLDSDVAHYLTDETAPAGVVVGAHRLIAGDTVRSSTRGVRSTRGRIGSPRRPPSKSATVAGSRTAWTRARGWASQAARSRMLRS